MISDTTVAHLTDRFQDLPDDHAIGKNLTPKSKGLGGGWEVGCGGGSDRTVAYVWGSDICSLEVHWTETWGSRGGRLPILGTFGCSCPWNRFQTQIAPFRKRRCKIETFRDEPGRLMMCKPFYYQRPDQRGDANAPPSRPWPTPETPRNNPESPIHRGVTTTKESTNGRPAVGRGGSAEGTPHAPEGDAVDTETRAVSTLGRKTVIT
jgi:hypothetical protein